MYEAKLLIVGEGGAGKTTLAKKIENQNYQLQEEDTTKGIEVIQWGFPTENRREFRVNIWDFGGQEIYHATHQFFLTKRSLYALVADTRKEDTDFYYWLNVVELLSDNSPLLIIQNEKQNRHREINELQLRGQFNNLKDTLPTNLATNRGLKQVLEQIKHHIKNLPHIGSPLPKTWVRVREALESDARNYISLDEYLKICEQNGFTQRKDKLQLSGYLHDLGVCLHFQEDPLLNKTVILKPKWGTDAVYKVLDNEKVIRNLGNFTRSDLANIWCEEEYATMHNELLRLMINFKLCYEIPRSQGKYIAPQLLSANQPSYSSVTIGGNVGTVVIQPLQQENNFMTKPSKSEENSQPEVQVTLPWAYRNGMFYLLVFAIVFNTVGIFAGILPIYSLALVIIGTVLFIVIIGVLQLRGDNRLSEKSFVELRKIVLKQLPLISNLIDIFQRNK